MNYAEFRARTNFDATEVLAFAHGRLVEDPPSGFEVRLPLPPMLMIDRIVEISSRGVRGRIVAERDVRLDDWFYQCHFANDPVQPGCLGVDAVWQLLGFYCAWRGALGSGRALGCGEIEFAGQIRPRDHVVRYEVDVRRCAALAAAGATLAVGDATVAVDGAPIYAIKAAKAGVFQDLAYRDYPNASMRSRGGILSGGRAEGAPSGAAGSPDPAARDASPNGSAPS
jgi:3-hydroxyacyl-[acyl-carrier protein] dehydratase / trans-2-decenoyl-[acyl-carrier protein] isomerase